MMSDKINLTYLINLFLPTLYLIGILTWLRIRFLKERYQSLCKEAEIQKQASTRLKRICDQYRFELEWLQANSQQRNSGKHCLEILKKWSPRPETFLAWIIYENKDWDGTCSEYFPEKLLKHFTYQSSSLCLNRTQSADDFAELPDEIEALTFIRTNNLDGENCIIVVSDLPECFHSKTETSQFIEFMKRLNCKSRFVPPKLIQFDHEVEEDIESIIAKEMLEIRSLLDFDFQTPQELMTGFLRKLAALANYSVASLYLHDENSHEAGNYSHFASGGTLPVGSTEKNWREGESLFVQALSNQIDETLIVTSETILEHAAEIPFRCGLILPVRQQRELVGVIMLTHTDETLPSQEGTQLVEWASQFLVKTLNREMTRIESLDQARRDGLTGLANRRTFDQELARFTEQAEATSEACSLILLDIDHFKSINDQYGHQVGDAVLQKFADKIRHLSQNLRVTDYALAARYGGEEFALILPSVGHEGALRIAEQLRQQIEDLTINHESLSLNVTASLGVSTTVRHGETAKELIKFADEALYAAKKSGRNCVCTTNQQCFEETEKVLN